MSEPILRCPFASSFTSSSSSAAIALPPGHPPLPPGHPPLPSPPPLATYTLESLLRKSQEREQKEEVNAAAESVSSIAASASSSAPLLISLKGCIFDVSSDVRFQRGGRWHAGVGRDMTRTLAFEQIQGDPAAASATADAAESTAAAAAASTTSSSAVNLDPLYQGSNALSSLTFTQLRTLETWYVFFSSTFPLVGRLLTQEEMLRESGETREKKALPGEADMTPLPSDIYGSFLPMLPVDSSSAATAASFANSNSSSAAAAVTAPAKSLHAMIDADEEDASCLYIASLPAHSSLLEEECTRTFMTPLHKAIEKGWIKLLRAILTAGARTNTPCSLYDNETPLQLAQRFQFREGIELLKEKEKVI